MTLWRIPIATSCWADVIVLFGCRCVFKGFLPPDLFFDVFFRGSIFYRGVVRFVQQMCISYTKWHVFVSCRLFVWCLMPGGCMINLNIICYSTRTELGHLNGFASQSLNSYSIPIYYLLNATYLLVRQISIYGLCSAARGVRIDSIFPPVNQIYCSLSVSHWLAGRVFFSYSFSILVDLVHCIFTM